MVLSRFFCTLAVLLLAAAQAAAERVELLDFYLPTCGPCHAMAPVIDALASEGVPVHKIDGSREVGLARRFRVDSYPTFVILVDGAESGRVVGATSKTNLRALLTKAGSRRKEATPFVEPDGPSRIPASQHSPLVESTVRLTVVEDDGRSYGAGTIIDARSGEALVVTCAHLFRDAAGRPLDTEGRLTIDVFQQGPSGPRVVQSVPGSLVVYDFEADVALVRMRPNGPVQTAPVAASPGAITAGVAVKSVGCDLGAAPSLRESRVVSLDRYQGPPNIETTGAPIQGRSGGGLFNDSGQLIGVCFAADNEADEGLYAGLASIHSQLDRIGLASLCQATPLPTGKAPLSIAMASHTAPSVEGRQSPGRPSRLAPVEPWPDPVIRGQDRARPSQMSPVERATLEEIARRSERSEVVFLIRPREPGGKTEVLTLDAASPAMVDTLRAMGAGSPNE